MVKRREDRILSFQSRWFLLRLGPPFRSRVGKSNLSTVSGDAFSQSEVLTRCGSESFLQPLRFRGLCLSKRGGNQYQHLDRSAETPKPPLGFEPAALICIRQ